MKKYILLSAFFLVAITSYSQNYVNKYVLAPFGNPISDIDWSASTADANGNIITVGNTIVDVDNVGIYTVKQNSSGQILWENTWTNPSLTDSKNYGIAVTLDNNDNIIVVGATTPDTELNLDIVALKFSPSGTQTWSKVISGSGGLADIPAAVTTNANGHIYLTGITQSITTQADFYTCKLHKNTGNLLWSETTDHGSGLDIATAIRLNTSGHPVITGVASTNGLTWDVKAVEFAAASGIVQNQNTLETTTTSDEFFAVDLKSDTDGNFYLLGQKSGTSSDIRLTKLNEDLEEEWDVSYDLSGNADEAAALTVVGNDLIVVTASSQNEHQRYELTTLAYKTNGVLQWQNSRRPASANEEVKGVKSVVNAMGHVYTTGEVKEDNRSEIVVMKYAADGKKLWEQRYGNGYDYVTGMNFIGDKLFVSAKNEDGAAVKYYTLRFEEYEKDNPTIYDDVTGEPRNRANELVVKFHPKALKLDNIDNLDITFGNAKTWLTTKAIEKLSERINFRNATFIRIFKNLKTTHTTSLTRLGETISIPDFWATFIIDFPNETDLPTTATNLLGYFPTVKYAHPNYVATLANVPNDPEYPNQASLHPTMMFDSAHINVEPFWEEVTGRPYIKVGVLDSGLDWEHEDFTYDSTGTDASVMIEGWDFETNSSLKSLANPDPGGHGTQVAGIVGAIRNNSKGIAGVAGGFPNTEEYYLDRGVSMYGMRIFGGSFFESDLEYIADGIVGASIDNPKIENSYGLHIMSNSWSFDSDFSIWNDENIQVLSESVHFANRNKVTFVASRGNDGGDEIRYPSCYNDDWVLNVGGTGEDGHYKTFWNGGGNWEPSFGQTIDIAAPCINPLIRTTETGNNYGEFNGTSAASPHAAGVVGLLMSYINTPSPTYGNLAPEDIEFIVQQTANNTDDPGYDELTGFGRLNAGEAFVFIRQPQRFLVHYGTDAYPSSKTSEQVATDITVNLTEPYDNDDGDSFAPGTYTADVYRVEATVNHNLTSTDLITHSWERHSSSTLFALTEDGGDLIPHEKIELMSVNQSQAVLEGYTYELKDASGNSLGWVPFDPADLDDAELTYSLLLQNTLVNNTDDAEIEFTVAISPNPVEDLLQIDISDFSSKQTTVSIIDLLGREVQAVYGGRINNSLLLQTDVSSLLAGMYYLRIRYDDQVVVRLFVKQ